MVIVQIQMWITKAVMAMELDMMGGRVLVWVDMGNAFKMDRNNWDHFNRDDLSILSKEM